MKAVPSPRITRKTSLQACSWMGVAAPGAKVCWNTSKVRMPCWRYPTASEQHQGAHYVIMPPCSHPNSAISVCASALPTVERRMHQAGNGVLPRLQFINLIDRAEREACTAPACWTIWHQSAINPKNQCNSAGSAAKAGGGTMSPIPELQWLLPSLHREAHSHSPWQVACLRGRLRICQASGPAGRSVWRSTCCGTRSIGNPQPCQ